MHVKYSNESQNCKLSISREGSEQNQPLNTFVDVYIKWRKQPFIHLLF